MFAPKHFDILRVPTLLTGWMLSYYIDISSDINYSQGLYYFILLIDFSLKRTDRLSHQVEYTNNYSTRVIINAALSVSIIMTRAPDAGA